jgi:hypothetical protein
MAKKEPDAGGIRMQKQIAMGKKPSTGSGSGKPTPMKKGGKSKPNC